MEFPFESPARAKWSVRLDKNESEMKVIKMLNFLSLSCFRICCSAGQCDSTNAKGDSCFLHGFVFLFISLERKRTSFPPCMVWPLVVGKRAWLTNGILRSVDWGFAVVACWCGVNAGETGSNDHWNCDCFSHGSVSLVRVFKLSLVTGYSAISNPWRGSIIIWAVPVMFDVKSTIWPSDSFDCFLKMSFTWMWLGWRVVWLNNQKHLCRDSGERCLVSKDTYRATHHV